MDLETFKAGSDDLAALFTIRGEKRIDKRASGTPESLPLPKHGPGERFIRGPIPMEWLKRIVGCGRRAEAVALLLWYAAGYQRRNPVKLTPQILSELSVKPRAARAILQKMADRGLVHVEFHWGRSPVVTLVSPASCVPDGDK
ncbi:MAG: hypothetical protein NXI32_29705 [bacterium]|nr:hypothetical protein [bacterium]